MPTPAIRLPERPSALSPRERVSLALQHRETDHVPLAMVCSGVNPPAARNLARHLGLADEAAVIAYLNQFLDLHAVYPDYIGPALGATREGASEDIWGVWRAPHSYGPGAYAEICHYPLAQVKDIADLDRHRWPSADWWDYASLPDKIASLNQEHEHAIHLANGNIFESAWYMRGFERVFLDLVDNPELAWEIMRRVTDYYIAFFTRALQAAGDQVDLVFTADDIAGQRDLLMSLEMWEQHLQPHHRRLNQCLHDFGVKVMYHSDGAVMKAVPGLIAVGVDVLQALQFSAEGMDPVAMKRNYGDRLSFQGGISVQTTLPFGTVEQVREEVRARIRVLARDGGYILGPSHAIQAGTPPENIVAMFDEALTCPMPSSYRVS